MAIQIGGTTVIDNSRNLTNIASIFSCTGIASQVEAEAGTSSVKLMTPQRVAQAIAALSGGSVINRIQRGSTFVSRNPPQQTSPQATASVPITSVTTSKSFISQGNRMSLGGYRGPVNNSTVYTQGTQSARLASATSVTVEAGYCAVFGPIGFSIPNNGTVDWEVIEFT